MTIYTRMEERRVSVRLRRCGRHLLPKGVKPSDYKFVPLLDEVPFALMLPCASSQGSLGDVQPISNDEQKGTVVFSGQPRELTREETHAENNSPLLEAPF